MIPISFLVPLLGYGLLCRSDWVTGFSPPHVGNHRATFHKSHPCRHQSTAIIPNYAATPKAKKTTTTTRLHVMVDPSWIVRGGAEVALNLARESFKLESMATYSTITALVMNASLRLYTSEKFARGPTGENGKKTNLPAEYLFVASTTLCIMSGIFTALLFNILGIYSKESLGMANHAGYLAFQKATAVYRKWGFRAFLMTCLSFVSGFGLSVWEKTQAGDRKGQFILVGSIVLALLGVYHIHTVLNLASQFIYTPESCAINNIA